MITYPFLGIIGQNEAILAIILNLVDSSIGGVLLKGTKGTGKSTIVYGIPQVCPEIEINNNCLYNCNPNDLENLCFDCKNSTKKVIKHKKIQVVNIPMSISEENLFGKINIEYLMKNGESKFIPGLLAQANRNILYIDEVNLLPDHITDSLLDVAASGTNRIEREGFSISHKCNFLLIGTMNQEEGELRPQILDRFSLSVFTNTVLDMENRKEIIRRNLDFENNPNLFNDKYKEYNEHMIFTIKQAREILPKVVLNENDVDHILKFLIENKIDGHRSEIVIIKAAKAYAAFELKEKVELKHLQTAMKLALLHRTREGGLKKPINSEDIDNWFTNNKFGDKFELFNQQSSNSISLLEGGLLTPSKK